MWPCDPRNTRMPGCLPGTRTPTRRARSNGLSKAALVPAISLGLGLVFFLPALPIRLRQNRGGTRVLVPKASVDNDDLSTAPEYQIRMTGEFSRMQPITEAHAVNQPPK